MEAAALRRPGATQEPFTGSQEERERQERRERRRVRAEAAARAAEGVASGAADARSCTRTRTSLDRAGTAASTPPPRGPADAEASPATPDSTPSSLRSRYKHRTLTPEEQSEKDSRRARERAQRKAAKHDESPAARTGRETPPRGWEVSTNPAFSPVRRKSSEDSQPVEVDTVTARRAARARREQQEQQQQAEVAESAQRQAAWGEPNAKENEGLGLLGHKSERERKRPSSAARLAAEQGAASPCDIREAAKAERRRARRELKQREKEAQLRPAGGADSASEPIGQRHSHRRSSGAHASSTSPAQGAQQGQSGQAWGRPVGASSHGSDLVLGMRKGPPPALLRSSSGSVFRSSVSGPTSMATTPTTPSGGGSFLGGRFNLAGMTATAKQRAVALEEEMELLNAEEATDVTTFDSSVTNMMDSRAHSMTMMAFQPLVHQEAPEKTSTWGESLERYNPAEEMVLATRSREESASPMALDSEAAIPALKIEISRPHAKAEAAEEEKAEDKAEDESYEDSAIMEEDVAPLRPKASRVSSKANALLMASHMDDCLPSATNRVSFLMQPGPREGMMQLYVKRIKGMYGQYPSFHCYTEQGNSFLLAARRRKKSRSSYFVISLDQHDLSRSSEGYIAKLRSNYVGTEYVGNDAGERRSEESSVASFLSEGLDDPSTEHVAVRYKQTVLSKTGGPRSMSAILKDPASMEVADRSLVDLYKAAKVGKLKPNLRDSIQILRNKKPTWDTELNGYVLDFQGRITEASVKNFQLARWLPGEDEPEGPVICQFGRKGKDTFALDYAYPLSVVQAFMIALSSMDIKLCYSM